jgi:hypothetical protein
MWDKIKPWLTQHSTWVGISSVVILLVTKFAPEHATLLMEIFAVLGVLSPDKSIGKLAQKITKK